MVKIKINGMWVSEENDIKEGVVQAFHSLLSKTAEWRPRCNGLQVGVLERETTTMLEAHFSEEEILVLYRISIGIKLLVLMVSQWRFGNSVGAF